MIDDDHSYQIVIAAERQDTEASRIAGRTKEYSPRNNTDFIPGKKWLHVYTDGSKLSSSGTGSGVFIKMFSQGVRTNASNFDGKITAARLAAETRTSLHRTTTCHHELYS